MSISELTTRFFNLNLLLILKENLFIDLKLIFLNFNSIKSIILLLNLVFLFSIEPSKRKFFLFCVTFKLSEKKFIPFVLKLISLKSKILLFIFTRKFISSKL